MDPMTAGAQVGDLRVSRALVRVRTKINELVDYANLSLIVGSGVATFTVGPTPPTSPVAGDLWLDTSP